MVHRKTAMDSENRLMLNMYDPYYCSRNLPHINSFLHFPKSTEPASSIQSNLDDSRPLQNDLIDRMTGISLTAQFCIRLSGNSDHRIASGREDPALFVF